MCGFANVCLHAYLCTGLCERWSKNRDGRKKKAKQGFFTQGEMMQRARASTKSVTHRTRADNPLSRKRRSKRIQVVETCFVRFQPAVPTLRPYFSSLCRDQSGGVTKTQNWVTAKSDGDFPLRQRGSPTFQGFRRLTWEGDSSKCWTF